MQEVAGERGGYLHGRGALDSDDLLYLKEQMEAEEDAERLLRRTEKRAFAAFKKAVADSSPALVPLPLRVEPKPKSGIRQQDLLKRVVEVKPKRQKISSPLGSTCLSLTSSVLVSTQSKLDPHHEEKSFQTRSTEVVDGRRVEDLGADHEENKSALSKSNKVADETKVENPVKSLLAAYDSSDDED